MDSTTDLHYAVLNVFFPAANPIFDNATDFDPTDGLFHYDSHLGLGFIVLFLFLGQFFATGLLHWLAYFDSFRAMALKTSILMQLDTPGESGKFFITDRFVMNSTFIGFA